MPIASVRFTPVIAVRYQWGLGRIESDHCCIFLIPGLNGLTPLAPAKPISTTCCRPGAIARTHLQAGLAQLDRYLAGLEQTTGWLIIFDQRPGLPPISDRTTTETATTDGKRAIVVIRG
ncbi:MAG: hypothetical protein AAGF24_11275 [Cyanobacteria bacterium P01_H01_bin.121]